MNRWWLNARVERFQKEKCRKPKSVSWEEREGWKAEETVIFVSHISSVCHDPVSMKQCPPLVHIELTDPLDEVAFTGVCVSLWGKVCLLYVCIANSQCRSAEQDLLLSLCFNLRIFHITGFIGKIFIGSIYVFVSHCKGSICDIVYIHNCVFLSQSVFCYAPTSTVFFHLITVQMGIKALWFIWQMNLFSDLRSPFKQHFDLKDSLNGSFFFCISRVSSWPVHIKCVSLLLFICCQMRNLSLKLNFKANPKLAN